MIKFTQSLAAKGRIKPLKLNYLSRKYIKETSQNITLAHKNTTRNFFKINNFSTLKSRALNFKLNSFKLALIRFQSQIPTQNIIKNSVFNQMKDRLLMNKLSRNFSFMNRKPGRITKFLQNLRYPLYYYIMGINTAVFIMFHTPVFDKLFLSKNLALSQYGMSTGRLWTLGTYGFVHQDFWHFLFNMFTFYFFAR